MNKHILQIIQKEFKAEEQTLVKQELESITPEHVMAGSEYNLNNTRMSIIKLAKGDLKEVITYTKFAKIDFRDVIMWAMESK